MKPSLLGLSTALVALCALGVPAATPAPPTDHPTYLVHDRGAADSGGLNDLNSDQVACGYISIDGSGDSSFWHAALFTNGRRIDLGTLGGKESVANALNDAGQVVGEAQVASGVWHAFRWSDTNGDGAANPGEMQDLGVANGRASRAYDINNHGEIVGEVLYPSFVRRAFRWKAGSLSLLPIRGASRSIASWIGDDGTILGVAAATSRSGYRPAQWRPGRIGELIRFRSRPYFTSGVAGRSAPGDIWLNLAGGISGPDPYVLRKGQKRLTRLAAGGDRASVVSVNRSGQAVGGASMTLIDDEGNEIFSSWGLYWHGTTAYELTELLQPGSDFTISGAAAINEGGWVAAWATTGGGDEHLVLLEPQNAS